MITQITKTVAIQCYHEQQMISTILMLDMETDTDIGMNNE
jgi:hypothetical protein